jgi:hypothetical protein
MHIPKTTTEMGCNHIYRLRAVDHVVCYDWEVLGSIPQGNYQRWCRNGIKHPDFREITYVMTEQPQQSGLLCIHLAIIMGFKKAYILGCDWGISDKSIFRYNTLHPAPMKYSNSAKRLLTTLSQRISLVVVNRSTPDVAVPVLSCDRFLEVLSGAT